jgi:predicted Zn-dependent protease
LQQAQTDPGKDELGLTGAQSPRGAPAAGLPPWTGKIARRAHIVRLATNHKLFLMRLQRSFRAFALSVAVVACATVPETGRRQLVLVDSRELAQLSDSEFEKLKRTTPISHDPEQNALVQRVGRRIAAVAPVPDARWEFVLFDEPNVLNAFAMPGGKVAVYSGLLAVTRDEAGLATVLGHEIAHVVARHGEERVSQGLLVELGGQALSQVARTNSAATRQLILGAYGAGAGLGVILPYSRKHELEADHIGMLYMARAGYDPAEAIEFWKRFAAAEKGGAQPPELLSTHPLDEKRIEALKRLLPEAEEEYRRARAQTRR